MWTARAVRTQEGVDAGRGRRRGLTDGMQRLLRMGDWDADAVGDVLCGYVLERLCTDGVVTVDENGCIKQGIRSVGGPGGTPEPAPRSTTVRSAFFGLRHRRRWGADRPGAPPARTWTDDRDRGRAPASTTNVGFAAKSDRARRTLQRVIEASDALRPAAVRPPAPPTRWTRRLSPPTAELRVRAGGEGSSAWPASG